MRIMFLKSSVVLLTAFLVFTGSVSGAEERAEAKKWFQDAKFGMFIHWGLYALIENGEWIMHHAGIHINEYEKLVDEFNPVKFDAEEWVSLAKEAGMNYITITSKHHDGFCLFDSKLTDYNIMSTQFKRDIMKEMADECRRQGLKIFFYYSPLDWHHPDYYPRGWTGRNTGRKEEGDWSKYIEYYHGQLKELCANYGEIGGFWLDGWWDKPDKNYNPETDGGGLWFQGSAEDLKANDWKLQDIYAEMHRLQPNTMIVNNHHLTPFEGEDYQTFERDLPGEIIYGYNTPETEVSKTIPLETNTTLNDNWGYTKRDKKFKKLKDIVYYIVSAACLNSNFLLNVGPKPNGEIDSTSVKRLKETGEWMREYGDSVYGTRGGPYTRVAKGGSTIWGSTWKDDRIFLHMFKRCKNKLTIPGLSSEILSASLMDGTEVELLKEGGKLKVNVPKKSMSKIDTIVVMKMKEKGPYTIVE